MLTQDTFRTQTTTFQGLGTIGMRMGIDGIKLLRGGGIKGVKMIFIVERYQGSTPMRTHIGMAMLGKMIEQLVEPVLGTKTGNIKPHLPGVLVGKEGGTWV